jgi:hypothetical protein
LRDDALAPARAHGARDGVHGAGNDARDSVEPRGAVLIQRSLSYGARIPYPDPSRYEREPLVDRIKRERAGKLLSSYPR